MRKNICHTELAFFSEYFLPLTAKCLTRSQMVLLWYDPGWSGQDSNKIGQKAFEVINYQIWPLLPGFRNCPTDIATNLKLVARILGVQ